MSFREKYWRYSLFVLIVGLGVTIFVELVPFLGGLLGAATIYVLLRRQMWYLSERRHWRRSVAASLLLAESIVVFLIPISLVVWMLVVKLQDLTLDPQIFVAPLRHVAELIRQRTGYDFWQEDNLQSAIAYLPRAGQWVVKNIADLAINLVVLLFVLYFMLIGGSRMESYVREMLPFNRSTGRKVMREIHMIVRSNAIGIPLLAIVQGIVAYLGYLLFGAPSPLFWGVATCFATIIPIVGTGLVWLPLAAYMALDGRWGAALGLCLYGMLVVTHVDNVVRFVMQKKLADTHPLVTIFGVVIGLSLFGFMGVIFGPLMLAMFIFCVDIFKRHYLEGHGHMAAYSDSSTSPFPPAHSNSPTSSFPPAHSDSSASPFPPTHSDSPIFPLPPAASVPPTSPTSSAISVPASVSSASPVPSETSPAVVAPPAGKS